MPIYHLLTVETWDQVKELSVYMPPSLGTEGFIHCSTDAQILTTAGRYFAGKQTLLALEIDPDSLDTELRWESSFQGDLFPHIYGPLNPQKIKHVHTLTENQSGVWGWGE